MKKSIVTFLIAGTALTQCADNITLVRNGKAESTIVLPAEPSKAVQLAAIELNDAVMKITGTSLPISAQPVQGKINIHIGDTELAKKSGLSSDSFKEQEYCIRFQDNAILLTGRDTPDFQKIQCDLTFKKPFKNMPSFWAERGPLNATYRFIENAMGVRYFNQTKYGTYYPETKTLSVPRNDVRRTPFMHYRDISGSTRAEIFDNSIHLLKPNSPEAKSWEEIAHGKANRRDAGTLFLLRRNFGGTLVKANHSFLSYYKYFLYKDAKEHIAYHPEYFAKGYKSTPGQLCSTNPELHDVIAKQIHNYFAGKDILGNKLNGKNWGEHNFAVVPDDNGLQCLCPECSKLLKAGKIDAIGKKSSSELIFTFVNDIAKKVKKTDPEETISCLAYADYELPPSFPLSDNIAVHYCFYANRAPASRPEYKACMKHFMDWTKRIPGRGLYLWLYNTFPHERAVKNNWNCFPGFFARQAAAQYKLFEKYGVRGIFHCGWGQELENYLSLRMMDDPSPDPEKIIGEYFQLMFGPAAKSMQKFYDLAESYYLSKENTADTFEIHWSRVGSPEHMANLRACINEAEKQAQESPFKERVQLWKDGIWKYMSEGEVVFKIRSSVPMPSYTAKRIPDAGGIPEKADLSNITPITEWYLINTNSPAFRKLSAKMAHDGKFLYLELIDPCDTTQLRISSGVFSHDCWELFMGNVRGGDYRQYAFGPTGLAVLMTHGEINFRKNVRIDLPDGIVSIRMPSGNDRWIIRIAMPLDKMLPNQLKPGSVFYFNPMRSAGPKISNQKDWQNAISSMVAYATLHDPYRMAEIKLEK